jgi:hypothetical protein
VTALAENILPASIKQTKISEEWKGIKKNGKTTFYSFTSSFYENSTPLVL